MSGNQLLCRGCWNPSFIAPVWLYIAGGGRVSGGETGKTVLKGTGGGCNLGAEGTEISEVTARRPIELFKFVRLFSIFSNRCITWSLNFSKFLSRALTALMIWVACWSVMGEESYRI